MSQLMRRALLTIIWLLSAISADAADMRVTIHSARPFGYFVGDLIRAHVEIVGPVDRPLATSSLPHPGPLGAALELREVTVHTAAKGSDKRWDIDLVYQNFYVALDARAIEIPSFDLRFGDEFVTIPAWNVGVAPLREIIPTKQERTEDYLRPVPPAAFVEETLPGRSALVFASLSLLGFVAVARDRALPPFHKRRERIFNALSRELSSHSNGDALASPKALQSVHRAIDRANDASLLPEDLPAFLQRRPEFAELRPSFDRFFTASHHAFFGSESHEPAYRFSELLDFTKALARLERTG